MKKFMQRLWKEESGVSHMVEIVIVIVVVIAVAGILATALKKSTESATGKLDTFIETDGGISSGNNSDNGNAGEGD